MKSQSVSLAPARARAIWLHAQRLDSATPFGRGPEATKLAIEHLGYGQIDSINVVERSHHHILYTRTPEYRRSDLTEAQSTEKSVFEYWTHALSYMPSADYRFFTPAMAKHRATPQPSFALINPDDYVTLIKRIHEEGALSIRDIEEAPVEKTHPWGSRKPSKRALRYGFFVGDLTISGRQDMVKTYDLTQRHFGWQRRPPPATAGQFAKYLLDRAIRSQGMVSLDSICYGNASARAAVAALIETRVRLGRLVPVHVEGRVKVQHWAEPAVLETEMPRIDASRVHILSPFDPLIIQRKQLSLFFSCEHRFEAYVPAERRVLGYFALPVLAGDEVVAALDLKADRQERRLVIQKWTWTTKWRAEHKAAIEEALERFESFQIPRILARLARIAGCAHANDFSMQEGVHILSGNEQYYRAMSTTQPTERTRYRLRGERLKG